MQLSTFLNLYTVCLAIENPAELCLEGRGRADAAMKTVLLTGGVGFIGTRLCDVYATFRSALSWSDYPRLDAVRPMKW